jgi:hypothetical protein
MSRPPKIKVKLPSGNPSEYLVELEQAREFLNFSEGVFTVEGQGIQSFDELVLIAGQEKYRDKEFIEVTLLQPIVGG